MSDLLSGLFGIFGFCLFFLGPAWAAELAGLPLCLAVAAVELALIVLSALRPVWWASRAGRVAQRVWRVALTLVAIAALNFVLNLIWGPRI
jgi:hypothetical protein